MIEADVTAATYEVTDGVLTFLGTGPTTLQAASVIAATATADTKAVVFEYLSNTYVYSEAGLTDTLVKLVGVTGVTFAGIDGNDDLFLV